MLQLENTTPFQASLAAFPDARGIDTFYAIVKATFALEPRPRLAAKQVPVQAGDEYWGDAGSSSLKYASEMHLEKPATDVVFVGQAWAPSGRAVEQLDVAVAVAERFKIVRVFGDRVWLGGLFSSISPTRPFESMPIVYERAYGGCHRPDPDSDPRSVEERNPVGTGFRGKRKGKEMAGTPLPNIEDPQHPIRGLDDRPEPQGFGFIAPSWLPRRRYAGTYDEAWQKQRAPYLPKDFDPRFFNAATPALIFDRHLQGGEPVRIINGHRDGPLEFALPAPRLSASVRIAGRTESPSLDLETILIEPDEDRLCMTWRCGVACDKKLLQVERVTIAGGMD